MASIWAYMCSILRLHINHSLCPSIPKFTDLICSVHLDLAIKKWLPFELICAVYIVTLNSSPCCNLVQIWMCQQIKCTLYVQYTKNPAIKKWLSFELICGVYSEYIVNSNFAQPYPILLTLYVQYTKNPAVKLLPFELVCAVYLEYIVTSNFVRPN